MKVVCIVPIKKNQKEFFDLDTEEDFKILNKIYKL